MRKYRKVLVGILASLLLVVLAGCGNKSADGPITVGSQGSDLQIWEHIAKSKQAKDAGLKIQVKEITDGTQLNKATTEGQVDVNAFQSWAYYQAYNRENPNGKLAALGTTYLEPMGIYSKKFKKLDEIKDGSTIAIANNPANTSRGLELLQTAGLIKLKKNFSALGDTKDITSNPKHLKFKEIDDTTGPRVLNDVDVVLISNTVALDGGLHVLTDSLFHEKLDQSTKDNVNILATAAKNKNNKNYKKLVKLYHNKDIQAWIKKKYYGTKIEVNKPLSYFDN
ncbi:MetQ/NlpA family ABC transporter substrate-binding protein [Companilactobacillus sp.]|jgi:D-methionine transport system substrate-binding protein|uniref:MetQ/NlpA family ABC transporter substrate-binding protein n=1 Tax=Companilactobacillus sp. TaxID=2767905 RepID=UPI0025B98F68|nr:MetQ/NlpA family ABC transporter substrate-binding protein [Companilactobacillus sp.]MCH4008839.1 MetQ/NlpA family ABC transporter substrate-binding protein [Companilactobacillus sp.]MCH4050982.1 MetQ/NlpA family ABC transporter substrate-binding protein [Companilactobacillus sp.]MCH4076782.1 MetQ/NlpA family ABC transporter substrate-binding protein [Companilactobacillus sp.]MCH4125357.1 MetQ/NlpA family ABC transporter substrate-binding protein [Companilactobacillus sp.]MCH4131898.1 MetQ/